MRIASFRRATSMAWALALISLVLSPLQLLQPSEVGASASAASGGSTFDLSAPYRMVIHPITTANAGPLAITTDSHGLVWFLEGTANRLASYDPGSGVFGEFPIPTAHSTPQSVVTDGSDNVWFTELSSDRLAELPFGSSRIVEFSMPSLPISLGSTAEQLGCGPGALDWDPSGSIWVACLFSNQVDEFFPGSHTFAAFELPVFPSGPAGLVLDGKGNLWFTAADANMLGRAVISQLRNGTSDGISEFAPLNQTYIFKFTQQTSLLGGTATVSSSLPSPSGIALDPAGRLWTTEHVDSSFDSYSPGSGTLVRYWTSQTHGANGFRVSFPNGISVGKDGTVWVAEHYGDKVAAFDPAEGQLTEYSAACCSSSYGGIYTLSLAKDGTPWFVEIQGNAIGELVPATGAPKIMVTLPTSATITASNGAVTIPLSFSEGGAATSPVGLSLDISGISGTGALANATASFTPASFDLSAGTGTRSNLTLTTRNLNPGTYYLTLTANALSQSILYSVILRLTVTAGSQNFLIEVAVGVVAVLLLTATIIFVRRRAGPRRG